VEELLIRELRTILEACHRRGIAVFVIGAFGVRAYGSPLRRTLNLDLAVEREAWPALLELMLDGRERQMALEAVRRLQDDVGLGEQGGKEG